MDKMERTAAGMFLALLVSAGAAGSELYTIALSAQTLSGATTNTVIADIYNGAQPGNFGWLTWTGSPSVPALVASLTPPGNSRSYINPDSPDDHTVSVGDWISGKPGVSNSKNVRNALDILTSQDIVVPVWDQARGQGANAAYRVSGFARVRLLSYRLPGQNRITARFLGFVFCGGQNQAPVVNAGGDQSATFPCPASLQGSVTDDGLPQPAMVTQYWSVVSGPGSVVFANSNAPITTATFGAPGVYTLRLTANDSELANYDDAVVTVNMPNRPPTAFPQQVAVPEDTALAITLSGNDPEADPLSFLVTVQPNHGSLTGAPPQLVYQPLADYNGPDLFSFKANDGQLDSSNATVNITVTPVNDPPVADSLTVTNVEDAAVQVAMSGADVDGDALSFVIVGNPGFHTLGTVSSNTVDCTPVHNFNGSDTFKYVTYDGLLYSATATVSLVTLAVNDAPTAAAQAVTAEEDTPAAITLAGSDPEGEALTFQIASAPAHGSLAGTAPNLTYTPATDYAGPDSFTFTATDASGAVSAPATVSITVTPVNDAPRVNAGPDIMLTALGSVALQGTVTDDGLPENGKLTTRWQVVAGSAAAVSFDDAARTTATATFTAPGDYTLRLTALDGAAAAHDELTVSIRLPNEAPTVEAGADFEVTVGTLATLNGSVTDDNQPEGGALVAQWSVISGAPEAVAFDNGGDPAAAARFTAVGAFTLRLAASDGELTASDTVSVTVVPVPNLPPTVHAGPPQEIALYAACRLLGGAEDDGLPEPGALSLLWEQTAGPGAAVISDVSQARPAVSFPAAGVYSFRLTASDGDLSASADTSVSVSLANQPPQVNAGEDFEMDAGLLALLRGQVNDDGLPLNAVPCSQWTLLTGPGLAAFESPDKAVSPVTVTAEGEYVFRLTASDGEHTVSDEVAVCFGAATNLAPVVDAGSDHTLDFNLVRTANLVVNPGGETAATNGVVPGWNALGTAWQTVASNSAGFAAAEGVGMLRPGVCAASELWQEVDVSLFADTIDDNRQLFEFSAHYRVKEQIRYDEPRITVEYRDSAGALLAVTDISPTPISSSWGLLADTRVAPAGTRAVRIRLRAENSGIDAANDVFFDAVALCAVELAGVTLVGSVTDDGRPAGGSLMSEWRMVSGPVAAIIDNASSLSPAVYFSVPGVYELALRADDGELGSEDSMTVAVVDDGSGLPLSVDAGTNQVVHLPLAMAQLQGAVGNAGTNALTVSWTEVSGHARVFIENADTLTPSVRFYELGEYTLRLSASDGIQIAYDEICVEVAVPELLMPMDVVMVIDHSGSMAGDRLVNAKLAAQQFIERLIIKDRAAVVAFESSATLLQELTFDLQAAADAIIPISVSGGTAINAGISAASNHLLEHGRSGAEWVILLLSDGGSDYPSAIAESQGARASGIRIMSVGLGTGTDERLMADVASSRGDYFFAPNANDLEPLYASLSRSLCRSGDAGLQVYTGPALNLPLAGTVVKLHGQVSYDLAFMSYYSVSSEWQVVSAPGAVWFENASSPVTSVRFSEPGTYLLALTGRVFADGELLYEKTRPLKVLVDQPSFFHAPEGLAALWQGEGNALDSVANYHGSEPRWLEYTNAPVVQGFCFERTIGGGVSVSTGGGLDVGASTNGFTLGFWTRIGSSSGEQVIAGWYDAAGAQFAVVKAGSGNRYFCVYARDAQGSVRSINTSYLLYTVGAWHHFAFAYEPSNGVLRVYRDGVFFQTLALSAGGFPTPGDFFLGAAPDGSGILSGCLDEIAVFRRALSPDEIWSLSRVPENGMVLPSANECPHVDAGADAALFSTSGSLTLSGFASDDGLPLESVLRARWRLLSGPGHAAFADPAASDTAVSFSAPGVYTLELSADDGVAVARDTVRVTVACADDFCLPPSGLRAHWPAEGTGREVVSGYDAYPVGAVSYTSGAAGAGFAHGGTGLMLARTGGGLDVGASTNGFTLEFWARIDSYSGEQVIAGWYDAGGAQFAVVKAGSGNRYFCVYARDAQGSVRSINTSYLLYTVGAWHHFAFAYEPSNGVLRIYRDGVFSQTLALSSGGFPTPGDFCIGGRTGSAVALSGATDEVSVYDRCLRPDEIWTICAAPRGKAVMGANLPPTVSAGPDRALFSSNEVMVLSGIVEDDGFPLGCGLRTYWRMLSGPGDVTFGDSAACETTAAFIMPGIYVLELSAEDGVAITRDTLRVTVACADDFCLPPAGLRAHWPAEGTGREVVSGYDAYPVGAVCYTQSVVGAGFAHGGTGLMLARTGGGLDVGSSTNGFTLEFWTRIDSYSGEQVIAGWYDAAGAQFAVVKAGSGNRYFCVYARDAQGSVRSINTSYLLYTVGAWHHFAFVYEPSNGGLRIYRDGVFSQTLALSAGGFPTPGDFCIGGRTGSAVALSGATDEVSVYDRALTADEIWAVVAAPLGVAVMDANKAPTVFAGPDRAVLSAATGITLEGVVADDSLPEACLEVQWRQLTGDSPVAFDDPADPQTHATFGTPGIYTLELSASDGLVVSRDTVRIEVSCTNQLVPPAGLCAHWPAEGTGREVVSGYDAYPVGAVCYTQSVVGAGFAHGGTGLMLARTGGGLDVGSSTNGFTVEFWVRIDSYSGEQVVAGWYDADGAQFAVIKRPSSYRYFQVSARDAQGVDKNVYTSYYLYTFGAWHHFAFTYDPSDGSLTIYRDGVFFQTLTLPAGVFPTPGDFCIGGRTGSAAALSGATDEVSVYDRALSAAEIQAVFQAGAGGKTVIPANQPPDVFAGYDRALLDTLSCGLCGMVSDDGCPTNATLTTEWTQLSGPGAAQILTPASLSSEAAFPDYGTYRFRLTVSDGEFTRASDVSVTLATSLPANIPPAVDAGQPAEITLPAQLALNGSASDPDAGPGPLTVAWSRAVGPAEVIFDDAASPVTSAAFSHPGNYVLRLSANDGAATALSHVAVVVHPYLANAAPAAYAGDDFTAARWTAVTLAGSASDDGVPSPLTYAWSLVSGPAAVPFSDPAAPDTRVQFTQPGTYVLMLTAFDGEKQGSDTVTATVYTSANQPPAADAGGPLAAVIGVPVELLPAVTDDGLPDGWISYGWRYDAGSGGCALSRDDQTGLVAATFSRVGEHTLLLTATDGEHTVADTLTVNVTAPGRDGPSIAIVAPEPGTQAPAGGALTIMTDASEPQGSLAEVAFYANGQHLGTRTNAPWGLTWQNLPAGTQALHAVAMNEIGQQTASAPVVIRLQPVPPGVSLLLPEDGSTLSVGTPFIMQAAPVGGAAVESVEFLVNGSSAAACAAPPYVAVHQFAAAGIFQLQARALLAGGGTLLSAPVSVTAAVPAQDEVTLTLDTPAHGGTVTAPTDITGSLAGGDVAAYTLQARACADDPADPASWRTLADGAAPLGAPGAPAVLGSLDPTLLRNGEYELRVIAQDLFGGVTTFSGHTVIVEGAMKVGHFQLAFEDLNIPLAGIPVQLLRAYDSRGGTACDFGPDWELGFRSVQVHTAEPVGIGWEDYVTRTVMGIPFYGIRPVRRHVVSVLIGEDVQQFEVYSPTEQGFFQLENASVAFRPINGSVGALTLSSADTGNMFIVRDGNNEAQLVSMATFDPFDPAEWVYTAPDGTRLDIRKVFGLFRLTDRNANSLTFTRDGITHSSGESVAFTRDAADRVTAVTAPGGVTLGYSYDAHGYLSAFVNRAGETNRFEYVPHPADPGRRLLHAITDPLGNRALAAGYDTDGRLVSQTDASGNAVAFGHDIPNRRQTVTDRLGNATVHEYDLRGNIVRTVDALGNATLRAYDENDNEVSVTDPLGNTTTRSYDANGNKLSETDPLGHTTSYTYDEFGNQLSSVDPLGRVTLNTYNAVGSPLATTDAMGNTSGFGYDAAGNLNETRDALDRTTMSMGYSPSGRLTLLTDASGVARSFTYDVLGNQTGMSTVWVNPENPSDTREVASRSLYDKTGWVTNVIDASGNQTWTRYNASGKPVARADALGNVTEYLYDSLGNSIQTRLPNGLTSEAVFDAEGRLVLAVDPHQDGVPANGVRTIYDALGRAVRTEALQGVVIGITVQLVEGVEQYASQVVAPGAIVSVSHQVYDAAGRVIETVGPNGASTLYAFDACGRNSAVADDNDALTSFEYDAAGQLTLTRDALERETRYYYDPLGRRVCTVYHDGTFASNVFDTVGNRVAEIDQTGKARHFGYDAQGRLASVTLPAVPDPDIQNQPVQPRYDYGYSAYGTLLSIADPLDRETTFAYDHLNRQTRRTLPLGQSEHMEYDQHGRLFRRSDFKGQVSEFLYNQKGQVSAKRLYAAGSSDPDETLDYAYDVFGRLVSVCGPAHPDAQEYPSTAYAYDSRNRVTGVETPEGSIFYEYDPVTGLKTRAWTDAGTETLYAYDSLNRLATVSGVDNGGGLPVTNVTRYTYTAVGSRDTVTLPNGVTTRYTYDDLNRLTSLAHFNAEGGMLAFFGYALAADGRRTQAYEILRNPDGDGSCSTNLFHYTYDNLNRLTGEVMEVPGVGAGYEAEYTYDLAGNRVSRRVWVAGQLLATDYTYDANDRLVREESAVSLAALTVTPSGQTLAGVGGGALLRSTAGLGQLAAQTAALGQRPLPGVMSRALFLAVPFFLLAAFLLPVLAGAFGPRRRMPAPDRLLTCFRLPLLMRGTASLLAATTLLASLPFDTLAGESDLYARLDAANWGRAGSVTLYSYDANGSLVGKSVTGGGSPVVETYSYDLQGRLARHVLNESDGADETVSTTDYRHNSEGIEVGRTTAVTVNGVAYPDLSEIVNYLIDSANPTGYAQIIEERDGGGTVLKSYAIGDDVLSQSVPSSFGLQPSYFLYDGHGSTRLLTDAQGDVTAQYTYDSCGVMLGQTAGAQTRQATDLLYSGERFDTALQQYYLRARRYDPANGQFTSLDPYSGSRHDPQSLHKYAYCHADPVNGIDPSGENYTLTGLQVTMSIISGLGAIVGVKATGGSWTRAVFTGVLYAAASVIASAMLVGVSATWFVVVVKTGAVTVAQAIVELVMEAIPNEDGHIENVMYALIMSALFTYFTVDSVPDYLSFKEIADDLCRGNKTAFNNAVAFMTVEFDWGMLTSILTMDRD